MFVPTIRAEVILDKFGQQLQRTIIPFQTLEHFLAEQKQQHLMKMRFMPWKKPGLKSLNFQQVIILITA